MWYMQWTLDGLCLYEVCIWTLYMTFVYTLNEAFFYNLKCGVTENRRNIRISKFGFETVSTIGAILWNDLPAELKNPESLKTFKQKIKLWSRNYCPCKICRKFIKSLGYI